MGLVLDSGVLIAAERGGKPVSDLLLELERKHGEPEVVISSITVVELEHGLHRANTAAVGWPAAKIDADAKRTGLAILGRTSPFEDLLIGVTALHFGYRVGTRNLRQFRMIPNLNVVAR